MELILIADINYYIHKLTIKNNYDLNLIIKKDIDEKSLVRINNSQLIRTILNMKLNDNVSIGNNKEFISELISVTFNNNDVYINTTIKNLGIYINGVKYVRLMSPTGQARKRSVLFICESLFDELHKRFLNGADLKNNPINPSKFNAYYSLYSSSSIEVSNCRVCVIDDYTEHLSGLVNFVDDDNNVHLKEASELPFMTSNFFDGQGLISPIQSRIWSKDLLGDKYNLNKPYCTFVIRNAYVKGNVVTFDYQLMAKENNFKYIIDIWGNRHNIAEIDLIISKSMMKLNVDFYKSYREYEKNCKINSFDWCITGTNSLVDDEMKTTNYQYLQALNLSDDDIVEIASYSVDIIKRIKSIGCDVSTLLLFLSNGLGTDVFTDNTEDFIQILMYLPELLSDRYIKNKVNNMVKNTIDKMSIGKLLVNGNYQTMISDPYSQARFALGLSADGLLKKRTYYSKFWLDRNINLVCASRSPLTDYSEHQTLEIVSNEKTNFWYQYLYSGIIYPVRGLDTFVHSGNDWDGDKIFTTSNKVFIKSIMKNTDDSDKISDIPPTCHEPKSADKIILYNKNSDFEFDALCIADIKTFGNDIGKIANFGTSLYALIERYNKDEYPKEYKILRDRLTALYRESGNSIDKGKGVQVSDFPKKWINKTKINSSDYNSYDTLKNKELQNKLAIVNNKKPIFMINIYPELKSKYLKYYDSQNDQCFYNFGVDMEGLKNEYPLTIEEQKFLFNFNFYSPCFMDNCNMNRVFNYVTHLNLKSFYTKKFIYDLSKLFNYDEKIMKENENLNYKKFMRIYTKFIHNKKEYIKTKIETNNISRTEATKLFYSLTRDELNLINENKFVILEWIIKKCSDKNKDFLWEIYSDVLLKKIKGVVKEENKTNIIKSNTSDYNIEFMGNYYKVKC